jgi:DNA-binding transcriptional LysR family regulator
MLALEEQLAGADNTPAGVVRLTATPILANRLLIPRLGPLLSRHAKLVVEIVAEPRNLSLTRRDADIAVRFARPEAGPMLCRRLGRISFSIYAPAGHATAALPWLTYEERFSHLPQARWIAQNTDSSDQVQLKVNDAESLYRATVAGLGRTVLPDFVAQGDARLVRLSPKPVVDREAWLLVHPDIRHLPRISVVVDWLIAVFAALEARSPDATPCPGS